MSKTSQINVLIVHVDYNPWAVIFQKTPGDVKNWLIVIKYLFRTAPKVRDTIAQGEVSETNRALGRENNVQAPQGYQYERTAKV